MDILNNMPSMVYVPSSLMSSSKSDVSGSYSLLINNDNMYFCVIINANNDVEVIFVYSNSMDYDIRLFCNDDDTLKGRFCPNSNDYGGTIYLEFEKSED